MFFEHGKEINKWRRFPTLRSERAVSTIYQWKGSITIEDQIKQRIPVDLLETTEKEEAI